MSSDKGDVPCEGNILNLGHIPVGQRQNMMINITPNGNSFIMEINAYLNYFIDIKVRSKSLRCVNVDRANNTYSCEQVSK